jgi:hypothetical protein
MRGIKRSERQVVIQLRNPVVAWQIMFSGVFETNDCFLSCLMELFLIVTISRLVLACRLSVDPFAVNHASFCVR